MLFLIRASNIKWKQKRNCKFVFILNDFFDCILKVQRQGDVFTLNIFLRLGGNKRQILNIRLADDNSSLL